MSPVINGAFVHAQEGDTTSAASGSYICDVWRWEQSGTGVVDLKHTADSPTFAESGYFSENCLHVDVTTLDAALSSAQYYRVRHTIEGFTWLNFHQKQFTISFWHKHTKTGQYSFGLTNAGGDKGYAAAYTQSVADTWEKAELTITASPSSGSWNFGNSGGLYMYWNVASGTDRHVAALDTWEDSFVIADSGDVNAMDSASNNFKLAQVRIDLGPEAGPFIGRNVQEELGLISRYLWMPNSTTGGVDEGIGMGHAISTTQADFHVQYPAQMRVSPTLSVSGFADMEIYYRSTTANLSAFGGVYASDRSYTVRGTIGSALLTAGDGVRLKFNPTSGFFMKFDARL